MSDDFYSEILWGLPDECMYTLEFRENGGKWYSTNEFNTKQKMKERLATMLEEHRDYRVVRLSKYPPHSVVEVIYYREAQR